MDLSMLERLSTDALMAMQSKIGELLKARLDTRVVPGRRATFIDAAGLTRTVRIDKLNRTTASCTEIDPESGKKWRVSLRALNVEAVVRQVAPPIVPVGKPVSPSIRYGQDAW